MGRYSPLYLELPIGPIQPTVCTHNCPLDRYSLLSVHRTVQWADTAHCLYLELPIGPIQPTVCTHNCPLGRYNPLPVHRTVQWADTAHCLYLELSNGPIQHTACRFQLRIVFKRSYVQISVRLPANLIKISRGFSPFLQATYRHSTSNYASHPSTIYSISPLLINTAFEQRSCVLNCH